MTFKSVANINSYQNLRDHTDLAEVENQKINLTSLSE